MNAFHPTAFQLDPESSGQIDINIFDTAGVEMV
jgi:hypothetical protein